MPKSVRKTSPKENALLEALPDAAYQRIAHDLEFIPMLRGDMLVQAGVSPKYVYFPATSVTSLIRMTLDGHATDVGLAGREGMVGFELLGDCEQSNTTVITRSSGYGYRLRAEAAVQECEQDPALLRLVLGFVRALSSQVSQISVCNRFHSARQQMCRGLLMILDRKGGNELNLTQDTISAMVGVRRETVSEIASDLQNHGIIKYRRGRILVTDRPELERQTCECYALLRREYEQVLPLPGKKTRSGKGIRHVTSIRRSVCQGSGQSHSVNLRRFSQGD